ncbi:MAG TPA: hypothetical protein VFN87_09605 [Solirubrobacteraceae bacterium]|nr:hypothetical protein [Solirubrobacteraceae bacterium]
MTSNDAVQIRQVRRARVRRIRGRVIGYSVALFVVLWSLIAVLLVTGHDPVLSRHAVAATTSGTGSSVSTGESGSDDSGSFSSAGSSNTAGSSNSTGSSGLVSPSPVTSGQS